MRCVSVISGGCLQGLPRNLSSALRMFECDLSSGMHRWNFIPKNLVEQFMNLANIYFLAIGILQIVPSISTVSIVCIVSGVSA